MEIRNSFGLRKSLKLERSSYQALGWGLSQNSFFEFSLLFVLFNLISFICELNKTFLLLFGNLHKNKFF